MSDKTERHSYVDGRTDLPFMVHSELDDIGLDPYEFRVYSHIVRRSGPYGNGRFWESVDNAAAHCRMDVKTYRRSLANLVKMRVLSAEARSGATTVYTPTPKSDWNIEGGRALLPLPHMVPLPDVVPEGNTVISSSPSKEVDTNSLNTTSGLFDAEAQARLLAAWNDNATGLAKHSTFGAKRVVNALKFVRAVTKLGDDPVEALAGITKVVVKKGHYKQGGYNLHNLLANENWLAYYDEWKAQRPKNTAVFAVGDWVTWLERGMTRKHGQVVSLTDVGVRVDTVKASKPGAGSGSESGVTWHWHERGYSVRADEVDRWANPPKVVSGGGG